MDSLSTVLTGLRFSLDSPARRIRQEALFLLDTSFLQPNLSLLWSINIAPLPGIEAGFAVKLDQLFEREPLNSPTPLRNGYYLPNGTPADTGLVFTVDSSGSTRYEIETRSFAARLTVDPMTLFTGNSRLDRGGRFYLEAVLLGWEKVFFYNDDRLRPLHFNAGVCLPTFGFLNVLRLQAELWPEQQWNSLLEIKEIRLLYGCAFLNGQHVVGFFQISPFSFNKLEWTNQKVGEKYLHNFPQVSWRVRV